MLFWGRMLITFFNNNSKNIINRYRQADDREIVFQLKQLLYETEALNDTGMDAKRIADLVAEKYGSAK